MVVFNQQFEKELNPTKLNWIILNSLSEFNDKSEMIKAIYEKLNYVKHHPMIKDSINPTNNVTLALWDWYWFAYKVFYQQHDKFPDIKVLKNEYPARPLHIIEDPSFDFSMQIYEEFVRWIDTQIIHLEKEYLLDDPHIIDKEKATKFTKLVDNFVNRNSVEDDINKDYLINLYDNYIENYNGVKTHIELVDKTIGVLGNQSIAVLGGPNSSGKTTLALTIAYNAAVFGGKVIDYISYESPRAHMWFNIAAIESYYTGDNLISGDMKQCMLDDRGRDIYKKCITSLMKKLNESGGLIKIHDATKVNVDIFSEFKSRLEKIAEERERPADLIIIDNIDSLKRYASSSYNIDASVNNMVIEIDDFTKTYYNNKGTCVLFLTQLSQEGIFKVQQKEKNTDNDNGKKKSFIVDNTAFRQYKTLGDRCTVGGIIFSTESMRATGRVNLYFTKVRERPTPIEPIKLSAEFAQSLIGKGGVMDFQEEKESIDSYCSESEEDLNKILEEGMQGFAE